MIEIGRENKNKNKNEKWAGPVCRRPSFRSSRVEESSRVSRSIRKERAFVTTNTSTKKGGLLPRCLSAGRNQLDGVDLLRFPLY